MILDDILATKRGEVSRGRAEHSLSELRGLPLYGQERRGFTAALGLPGRRIIAEIKKASPSRGVIRQDFEAALHARQYEQGGAACLSVLTDREYFSGSLACLEDARAACALPLLRKDFMVDEWQLTEARAHGADAVLLIVAALPGSQLDELYVAANEEGLDVLVEVHDEIEMERAAAIGAALIGINNRDLKTFNTSTDVTRRLAPLAPEGALLVSESGLGQAGELGQLEEIGVTAFLLGESLMSAADPGAALAGLLVP